MLPLVRAPMTNHKLPLNASVPHLLAIHRQAEGLHRRHLHPLSTMSSKCLLHGGLPNMQDMKKAYVGGRRSCAMDIGCSLCLRLETHEAIILKR